jgi:hypothetical protein
MRLWTVQDKAAYEGLRENGVLRCNAKLADWLREEEFKRSYDWLALEMKKRIGAPPANVEYPIWAWYLLDGKNTKPDLRRVEFRNYTGKHYVVEAEVAESDVLLSDEEMWHFVLNNWYFNNSDDEDATDEADKRFDVLPSEEQDRVKRESWQKIFEKSLNPWRYVQATFWELRTEQVVSARKFFGKRRENGHNGE